MPHRQNDNASTAVSHRVVEPGALTGAEVDRWIELRKSNPQLDSPYFHPGFTMAVAATRPEVRVIVGEGRDGTIGSFLPVQFDKRVCHPAGFPAADFQGPVCANNVVFDIQTAVRAAGAQSYEFDHMRAGVVGIERWIFAQQRSPYIDISGGMDGYLSRASRSGKENVAQARRRSRRAERDFGSIRFVAASDDPQLLDKVIALKRRQYAATGSRDYFSNPNHVRLLHELLAIRGTEFEGMLSALYAGPHLLAAHFGLRSGAVLHWWFPVYDPEFSRLAPGWLLLRALIDLAPELSLTRLDLGRGDDEYKRRAMTGEQVVCQGAVVSNPLRRTAANARRTALQAIRSSRLAPTLRRAVRVARRRAG